MPVVAGSPDSRAWLARCWDAPPVVFVTSTVPTDSAVAIVGSYETTSGMRSLDLLGRRAIHCGGAAMAALGEVIESAIERASPGAIGGEAPELAQQLKHSWTRLLQVTAALLGAGDVEVTTANSAVYLEAFGHIMVGWKWLEQYLTNGGSPGDFYEGKRRAVRYFFVYELPKTGPQLNPLEAWTAPRS